MCYNDFKLILDTSDEANWLHINWFFYKFVNPPKNNNKCWQWKGPNNNGYGYVIYNGKRYVAHRLSWELHHNKTIPKGKLIRHLCNNPLCVNPITHLQVGTQKENMLDMRLAGREGFIRKITPSIMASIRKSKLTGKELSKKYNVSQSAVSLIKSGKRKPL